VGLSVGIAGFGLAGQVFHAPLVAAADGLSLAKVMTRSPERAAQAHQFGDDVAIVETVEELVDGMDVVVVATPNSSHVEVGLAALEAGAHVVVDKPIAVTAADAQRLVDAGSGRVTVFQNRRWDGDFLTVRRLIGEGTLGELIRFESRFERFRPEIKEGWREGGDPSLGGGVLLDLGPHVVDQAVELFGPPESVYGEVAVRRPGAQVDDDAFIALHHPGGVVSHLWMSAIAPLYGPRFRVSGMAAGFACDGLDPQEAQLRAGMRPGDPGWGEGSGENARGAERAGRLVRLDGEEPVALERGAYERFYEGVRDWTRGETAAPVDPAGPVRVLEILETARGSGARRSE
jgi:scyllo-inositol 2-dehydrogenase (NADP+)